MDTPDRPDSGYQMNIVRLLHDYGPRFVIVGDGIRYRARRKRKDGRPFGAEMFGDTLDDLADEMDAWLRAEAPAQSEH